MMNDDVDLDRRLGDLFGGSGLDLVPRADATTAVLTRVRRIRRRRRAIQVAAPVLTAICLTGAVLATQAGRDLGAPPAGRATPTATVAPDGVELEMTGTAVGPLRLGMTAAQAEATGLLDRASRTVDSENPDCVRYAGRSGVVSVTIGRRGVSAVQVYPFIHTPQGVAVGDRYRQLQAAYPATVPSTPDIRDSYRVPVPGTAGGWYEFRLDLPSDGPQAPTAESRIAGLSLVSDDRSCD